MSHSGLIGASEMMEVVVITGVNLRAKLQSNRHHQQTETQFFLTGRMPFLLRNQQCQTVKALKGNTVIWITRYNTDYH